MKLTFIDQKGRLVERDATPEEEANVKAVIAEAEPPAKPAPKTAKR